MAHLTAPATVSGEVDKRRDFYRRLGALVNDPRYAVWGEVVHQGFRHGIAHTFLPKQTADIACVTMWLNGHSSNESRCIDVLAIDRRDLRRVRAEHHLRFEHDTLIVVPQIFYLDLRTWLEHYEQSLQSQDPSVLATLSRTFPRWWQDTTAFKNRLRAPEIDYVEGRAAVPSIHVEDFWTVVSGSRRVAARLERDSGGWAVVVTENALESRHSFRTYDEAEDFQIDRKRELGRNGFT